jgi:hypothetical protein
MAPETLGDIQTVENKEDLGAIQPLELGRIDSWYSQLYAWHEATEKTRKEVIDQIVNLCNENLAALAEIVAGRFLQGGKVVSEVVVIKFPELFFSKEISGRKFNFVAKIRINPCKNDPIISIKDTPNIISAFEDGEVPDIIKKELIKNNKPLSRNYSIMNIIDKYLYAIKDGSEEFIIINEKDSINIYIKPFYSKVWIIISCTDKISTKLNKEIFDYLIDESKRLCEKTAELYIGSIKGGATAVGCCSHMADSIYKIKIRSIATTDDRIKDLFGDPKNKTDYLVLEEKLKKDESFNFIINCILTNLCDREITNWRENINDDCVKLAKWRFVFSSRAKGIFSTRNSNADGSITLSAAFSSEDNSFNSVYGVLRIWVIGMDKSL